MGRYITGSQALHRRGDIRWMQLRRVAAIGRVTTDMVAYECCQCVEASTLDSASATRVIVKHLFGLRVGSDWNEGVVGDAEVPATANATGNRTQ